MYIEYSKFSRSCSILAFLNKFLFHKFVQIGYLNIFKFLYKNYSAHIGVKIVILVSQIPLLID